MKTQIPTLAALAALASLAACADMAPTPSAFQATIACPDKASCDATWARAQLWLVQHGRYRMQIATDSLLQTAGPIRSDPTWAFVMTRTPKADGSASILVQGACGNMFGCIPSAAAAEAAVRAALAAPG